MPIFRLGPKLGFPDPELADPSGLLAVGGDLSPERLLLAYASGIFPWFSDDEPILWWSPTPRFVLEPSALHVSSSLRKTLRRGRYRVTFDTAFAEVVAACAEAPRPGQEGTWITEDMQEAYRELHALGYAHSIEAWQGDQLVGGLYGVSQGHMFAGESMFARAPDASKVAFVTLVQQLSRWGFDFIDCQVETEHLERFGARHVSRSDFLTRLAAAVQAPTRLGPWQIDDLAEAAEATSPSTKPEDPAS